MTSILNINIEKIKLFKYAMTITHEVNTAREPINVAKATINFEKTSIRSSINLICLFLNRIIMCSRHL